jgi:hypothetical protein
MHTCYQYDPTCVDVNEAMKNVAALRATLIDGNPKAPLFRLGVGYRVYLLCLTMRDGAEYQSRLVVPTDGNAHDTVAAAVSLHAQLTTPNLRKSWRQTRPPRKAPTS